MPRFITRSVSRMIMRRLLRRTPLIGLVLVLAVAGLASGFDRFVPSGSGSPVALERGAMLHGRVVGVADGDTLTILAAGNQRHRIRLAEIDAPESGQAFGRSSKQLLSDLCFGVDAAVRVEDIDRYQRVVGRVHCREADANAELVEAGLAWVYTRYARDRHLFALEAQARAARRGLWADPDPVAPWDFRRR